MVSHLETYLRLRNRDAAQKCRKLKQRDIWELQNKEAAASELNRALAAEMSQLRDEVLMLKSMVLQHGGCGCSFIEDYIQCQASQLVNSRASSVGDLPPVKAEDMGAAGGLLPPESDLGGGGGYSARLGAYQDDPNAQEEQARGLVSTVEPQALGTAGGLDAIAPCAMGMINQSDGLHA